MSTVRTSDVNHASVGPQSVPPYNPVTLIGGSLRSRKTRDKLASTSAANALDGTKYKAIGAGLIEVSSSEAEVNSRNRLCSIANSAIVVFPDPVGVQRTKDSSLINRLIPITCEGQASVLFR